MSLVDLFWKSEAPKKADEAPSQNAVQPTSQTAVQQSIQSAPSDGLQSSQEIDLNIIVKMVAEYEEIVKKDYPIFNKFNVTKMAMIKINPAITDEQVLEIAFASEPNSVSLTQIQQMKAGAQAKVTNSFNENVELAHKQMEEEKASLGLVKVEIQTLKQTIASLEEKSIQIQYSIDAKYNILNNASAYKADFINRLK